MASPHKFSPQTIVCIIGIFIVCLITYFLYSPGLSGRFILDDSANILTNDQLKISDLSIEELKTAATSGSSGPLGRPLSYLSFAINYYVSGFDPYSFKLANIAIHLLNGVSIFILSILILLAVRRVHNIAVSNNRIAIVSIITTAIWLFHPVNLTSVLYIVQRMNSLAALFTIWGIIFYIWARLNNINNKKSLPIFIIAVAVFLPLAALSKENGLLLPLYTLAAELLLLRFSAPSEKNKKIIIKSYIILISASIIVFATYTISHPDWISSGYALRNFTLYERIATEPRIIWFYIQLILFPSNQKLGLFHDDIETSSGIFNPITTIVAITGIILIAFLCFKSWRSRIAPIASFGLLFFLCGHALESSIFPLEITFEHRNYLPSYGIILPLTFYLTNQESYPRTSTIRYIFLSIFVAMTATLTYIRADYWGDPIIHRLTEVQNHPDSPRANIAAGNVHFKMASRNEKESEKHYQLATQHFTKAANLDNRNTVALFFLQQLNLKKATEAGSWATPELHQRLRKYPPSAATIHWIRAITVCSPDCMFSPEITQPIMFAILGNPHLKNKTKTNVLIWYSKYMQKELNNTDIAYKLLIDAIKLDSNNPQHYLYMAELLYTMGYLEEAKQAIKTYNQINKN